MQDGLLLGTVSERVFKLNRLSWTVDSDVHVVHISHVIIAYTLESFFLGAVKQNWSIYSHISHIYIVLFLLN